MSAQKASRPVRFARLAAAAVMVVLAGAVVIRFVNERGVGPRPAAVKPPPEDRSVDLKERVRHQEFRDGRLRADVRGDSFFLGPDGRNHLKGSVEILDYGPSGEVVSRITADEVVYDADSVHFVITGRVRVEASRVILEGGSFDYDKDGGLFRTAAGGVFSSDRMSGTAAEILYAEGADEVRFYGGFRAELAATGRDGQKTVLSGDSFSYQRRERRGRAEGRAEFERGRCRGAAQILSFDAADDESFLKSVALDGAARVTLAGRGTGHPDDGVVTADWIGISFAPDDARLSSIQGRRNLRLSLSSSDGSGSVVGAAEALLTFGADGEPERWSASGGCRVEIEGDAAGSRVIEAESAAYDASTRVLRASGRPGQPAVADSPRARVEAGSIVVGSAAGDLEASGGAKCLLKPAGESRAAGFFSAAKPVFVSCLSLVFRGETKSSSFRGEVQAWQDEESLLAGELDFFEATGEMRGRGGVAVGMGQAAAGESPERRLEAGGEDMTFSAAERKLSFRKKGYVQLTGARLAAETITAVLRPEGQGVETFTARTGVVVSKGRYEGRGDAAFYQAETDRVTLTGRPVLVDREGGSSRGDKLTFDLGDSKILVENEGQGRSITVVKS
jgi:lipopolysaccharide export system protein LptA